MPTIEIAGVTRTFAGTGGVRNISLAIKDGSFTTLLGSSGCGKTTTLRLIAGLERPDDGAIKIDGKVVSSSRAVIPPDKRNIGFVFQSYALWPHMTVFDNVAFPLRVRGVTTGLDESVRTALEMVGLEEYEKRLPSELSGGQQQRVAVARAVSFNPSILLLDEPLSNLDAELRKTTRAELRRLHDRLGITTVYVTHDQFEALSVSDRIVVMADGAIVEEGTPAEIYSSPASPFTARFVSGANMFAGTARDTGDGNLRIDLDTGGTLDVPAMPGSSNGASERVIVAVNAEDLTLDVSNGGGPNCLSGEVDGFSYLGSHSDATVRLGNAAVRVRIPKVGPLQIGQQVGVVFPPDRVRLFRS